MPEQEQTIPTLPTYPTPRGIPLLANQKDQKPLMKAIKMHMKHLPRRPKSKRREVKWW